ncbi:MAG: toxin-antitoxin system HicB family antitoxin [Thermomicrobiales bacterium]
MATRPPLSHYLDQTYPYTVVPDNGSFFIEFPDLPGCMSQVEDASDIASAADEIRMLWIETEYDRGATIPEPAGNDGFSGKFLVRVPKSLHHALSDAAHREGVSLNAYVTTLLAQRSSVADLVAQLTAMPILADIDTASPNIEPDAERRPQRDTPRTRSRPERSAAD